jgi:hypothetical protein
LIDVDWNAGALAAERSMCAKCVEIDKAIAQYLRISKQGLDPLTTSRIKEAIAEMERRKAALHPVA